MVTEKIWQLLERGGLARSSEAGAGGEEAATLRTARVPKYDGLADPTGAEELGRLLADRVREFKPTAVLLWEDPQDIVLGHVVARELGVHAVRSYNEEGLAQLVGVLPPKSRVVLLADAFREPGFVRAMSGVVEQHDGAVVGTAVLADTEALSDASEAAGPVVSLVTLRGDERVTGEIRGNGTH